MKLRERILALLRDPAYSASDETALARELGLVKKDRRLLTHEVRLLVASGELNRVKGDRLVLAGEDNLLTGKIQFRAGGSAFFLPEPQKPGELMPMIQIAPDDSGVALRGDRVAVKAYARLSRRRDGRGEEQSGRVVRIVSRARDTIVGHLQR